MRILLELMRIIFMLAIVCVILGYFINALYIEIGVEPEKYGWIGFTAIFILFFVLYRNKLQFSGWYKGKDRRKLPKKVTHILIFSSIGLLLLPPVLSFFVK